MSKDCENCARKVMHFARTQEQTENIADLVSKLENVSMQSCEELLSNL